MPRIFDCFTFFDEFDVLELRLEELYPVVDHFIIVEADRTFRGEMKGYSFILDAPRWEKYADKIIHAQMKLPRGIKTEAWTREFRQRNHIKNTLKLINPDQDDIILISDVDEIPRRSVIENLEMNAYVKFFMEKFSYGINMKTGEGNTAARAVRWSELRKTTPQKVREASPSHTIYDAGWEFSSLGTPDRILKKLKSFSHSEFDTPDLTIEVLESRMARGQDIVGRDFYHEIVEVDDTWPEGIKNNREYWSKYEW